MNRRNFLKSTTLTGLGAFAGLSVLQSFDLSNVQAAPMRPDGAVREIPLVLVDTTELQTVGGAYHLEIDDLEKNILVVRAADERFLAIDLKCTHKGCELYYDNSKGEKFLCPCHGSEFSLTGQVLVGPAKKPVVAYRTSFANGTVIVYVPENGSTGGDSLAPGDEKLSPPSGDSTHAKPDSLIQTDSTVD